MSRLASTLSIFGMHSLGATLSVISCTNFGASLSLRSFSRLGSSLSIGGALLLGADLRLEQINAAGTNAKRMTMKQASDEMWVLHGLWQADQTIGTSDRRLKANIMPLGIHLQKHRAAWDDGLVDSNRSTVPEDKKVKLQPKISREKDTAASWMLRELRPVSFRFKSAPDSKGLPTDRFGFVAQEVKRVAPSLVREAKSPEAGDGLMALAYQDLLAVLILNLQEQQKQMNRHDIDVLQATQEVEELLDAAESLEHVLDSFEASTLATARSQHLKLF
jgi:hypothetical protein